MSHSVDPEYANNARELIMDGWNEYARHAKDAMYIAAGLCAIYEAVAQGAQRDGDGPINPFKGVTAAADRRYCRWLGVESSDGFTPVTPLEILRASGLATKELQELCDRLESEHGPRIPL